MKPSKISMPKGKEQGKSEGKRLDEKKQGQNDPRPRREAERTTMSESPGEHETEQ